jgi:hypothetical protein
MESQTIGALAALFGSLIGAGSSVATSWAGFKYAENKERRRQTLRKKEQLYSEFITETATLLLDAYDHDLQDLQTVTKAVAVLNRIRLVASDDVLQHAEDCMEKIIERYFKPNMTLQELHDNAAWRGNDPLKAI